MADNKFIKKLEKIQKKNNSLVCVGLDTNAEKIPNHLKKLKEPIFSFNKKIIDSTFDLVCAYKPNIAFYEAEDINGLKALKKTIDYLRKKYPEIPIILDAKRADIGNTNKAYVRHVFKLLKADALTLHPYLGRKALMPFLNLKNKFFFILCKTSNPGADELQNLKVRKKWLLYQYLAKQVKEKWNLNNNCGLVVGATYPKELKEIRKIAKDMILLIPGVGKQGGEVKKIINLAKNKKKQGMIINSSRSIIFASNKSDFAQAARKKTRQLKKLINKYR